MVFSLTDSMTSEHLTALPPMSVPVSDTVGSKMKSHTWAVHPDITTAIWDTMSVLVLPIL